MIRDKWLGQYIQLCNDQIEAYRDTLEIGVFKDTYEVGRAQGMIVGLRKALELLEAALDEEDK